MTFLRQSLLIVLFIGCAVLKAKSYPEGWDWPLKLGHVEIVSRGVNDFKKIQHFFYSEDPRPQWLVLRTDPDVHAGVYFESSFNHSPENFPPGSCLKLRYITKNTPTAVKVYTLAIPAVPQWRVLIGLTDKACGVQHPYDIFAWCMGVYDAHGSLLAEKKSFLWEKPSSY